MVYREAAEMEQIVDVINVLASLHAKRSDHPIISKSEYWSFALLSPDPSHDRIQSKVEAAFYTGALIKGSGHFQGDEALDV